MRLEVFDVLDETQTGQWREFNRAASHQHPRQDPRFSIVEHAANNKTCFVIGKKAEEICAVALFSLSPHPVFPGLFLQASAFSGPICDQIDDLEAFLSVLVRLPEFRKVGRLKISPYWVAEDAMIAKALFDRLGWVSTEEDMRQTGLVDIARDRETLLASFSKSARREVRRALRQNISIRRIEDIEMARVFLDSLNALRHRRNLPVLPLKPFEAVFQEICRDGDAGVIFGAFDGSYLIAGLQLYRGNICAHGRHFTSDTMRLRALSNLRIAPLLWLEGMLWARAAGCRYLDVEGYDARIHPDSADYNIYKYKGEFRPEQVPRVPESFITRNIALDGHKLLKDRIKTWVAPLRDRNRRAKGKT